MPGRPFHNFFLFFVLGCSSWPKIDAFVTPLQSWKKIQTSRLHTSTNDDNSAAITQNTPKAKLSRPERKALQRQKKEQQIRKPSKATQEKYKLHSSKVSNLTTESTADDVMKAIKRAQNLHDHHDLRVIADFLIDECDVGFAYGYRGSLLARLAVAALHFGNHNVARRAIDIRRVEYRSSMMPMESAAIIRGLLRVHNATDALEALHDELSLPLEVRSFVAC